MITQTSEFMQFMNFKQSFSFVNNVDGISHSYTEHTTLGVLGFSVLLKDVSTLNMQKFGMHPATWATDTQIVYYKTAIFVVKLMSLLMCRNSLQ